MSSDHQLSVLLFYEASDKTDLFENQKDPEYNLWFEQPMQGKE